jgi:cell surface protein SprA
VFNLDKRYNVTLKLEEMVFFDFMQGITIDSQNGRVIFTTKEPFGGVVSKLSNTGSNESYDDLGSYNQIRRSMASNMYRNAQSGALQVSEKINFFF